MLVAEEMEYETGVQRFGGFSWLLKCSDFSQDARDRFMGDEHCFYIAFEFYYPWKHDYGI